MAHSISQPETDPRAEPMGRDIGLSGFCPSSLEHIALCFLPPPAPWRASQARLMPDPQLIARF